MQRGFIINISKHLNNKWYKYFTIYSYVINYWGENYIWVAECFVMGRCYVMMSLKGQDVEPANFYGRARTSIVPVLYHHSNFNWAINHVFRPPFVR